MNPTSVYFYTLRSDSAKYYTNFLKDLDKHLSKSAEAWIIAQENKIDNTYSEHIHAVILYSKPRRHDAVKKSLNSIAAKHFVNYKSALKIGYDGGVISYVLKDGAPLDGHNIPKIKEVISEESAIARQALKTLRDIKTSECTFALKNFKTWVPIMEKIDTLCPGQVRCDPKVYHSYMFTSFCNAATLYGVSLGSSKYITKQKYNAIISRTILKHYSEWLIRELSSTDPALRNVDFLSIVKSALSEDQRRMLV